MPLYEYQCEACGHRFEAIQKFSDTPLEQCPKCGGAVRKLQSAPAFQFKGSGWYITDYGKKDSSSPGKTAETPAAKDTTSSSESAGAAKAESSASKGPAAGDSPKSGS